MDVLQNPQKSNMKKHFKNFLLLSVPETREWVRRRRRTSWRLRRWRQCRRPAVPPCRPFRVLRFGPTILLAFQDTITFPGKLLKNYVIQYSNIVKPVYNGHPWDLKKVAAWKRCVIKLRFRLVVNETNWPLLTGGRYSQVVIKSGLTVLPFVLSLGPRFYFFVVVPFYSECPYSDPMDNFWLLRKFWMARGYFLSKQAIPNWRISWLPITHSKS